MSDDFVKEHLSGLLLSKIGHTGNEEGIFGELTDEHEEGVVSLTFGEFSYEVHGDDFERLCQNRNRLK